jgi:hypothetical protein
VGLPLVLLSFLVQGRISCQRSSTQRSNYSSVERRMTGMSSRRDWNFYRVFWAFPRCLRVPQSVHPHLSCKIRKRTGFVPLHWYSCVTSYREDIRVTCATIILPPFCPHSHYFSTWAVRRHQRQPTRKRYSPPSLVHFQHDTSKSTSPNSLSSSEPP